MKSEKRRAAFWGGRAEAKKGGGIVPRTPPGTSSVPPPAVSPQVSLLVWSQSKSTEELLNPGFAIVLGVFGSSDEKRGVLRRLGYPESVRGWGSYLAAAGIKRAEFVF